VVVDGVAYTEPDAYVLRHELAAVDGAASPDTLASWWTAVTTVISRGTDDRHVYDLHAVTIGPDERKEGHLIGPTRLLAAWDDGQYRDLLAPLAGFMRVVYSRGNFALMPALDHRAVEIKGRHGVKRYFSLNKARADVDRDFPDRFLATLRSGAYNDFVSGDVPERFRLDIVDGKPTEESIQAWIAREHLAGLDKSFYDGEVDRFGLLSIEQTHEWADNSEAFIIERNQWLDGAAA
jgi:hypothetical protein